MKELKGEDFDLLAKESCFMFLYVNTKKKYLPIGCANREKFCRKSNKQILNRKLGESVRLSASLQFFFMDV